MRVSKVRHLVIPAAGLGTRMKPVNPELPKELLPVGGKPAIQYAVDEGLSAGMNHIFVIINKDKELIRRYFEDKTTRKQLYPEQDIKTEKAVVSSAIKFIYQEMPVGEADAIGLTEKFVGENPVALIYPDNIFMPSPGALAELEKVFMLYGKDTLALTEISEENSAATSNAGRVDLDYIEPDIFSIRQFHNKGPGHFVPRFRGELKACGMNISGPHIYGYIERARSLIKNEEFTDWHFRNLIHKEKGLLGCHLKGSVFDIGNPKGYEFCMNKIAERQVI
jgi:UTP--glucose-1-phosphate uridylyltransferase